MTPAASPESELRAAAAALGRRDGADARRRAEPVARRGGGVQAWAILAEAARLTRDDRLLEEAADRVVALEPRAIVAYGWKGDCRDRAGDARGAATWFRAGLAAAGREGQLPPQLRAEIERMQASLHRLEAGFAAAQAAGLRRRGIDAAVSRRFAESIDLLNGKVEVQLQQPTTYYFPGLPQQAFYEREAFDWVPDVEAATPAIRAELDRALAADAPFRPYVKPEPGRPQRNAHGLLGDDRWSTLHLIEDGVPNALAERFFPETLRAMAGGAAVPHRRAGRPPSCSRCSRRARAFRRTTA